MTVESALLEAARTRLTQDTAFAALAGERVYVFAAPEKAEFPCVVLSLPEAAIPDETYAPNRETFLDLMVVARQWSAVNALTDRAKTLLDLQTLADVIDCRLSSVAYYSEREGRDHLFYGTTRYVVLYTE